MEDGLDTLADPGLHIPLHGLLELFLSQASLLPHPTHKLPDVIQEPQPLTISLGTEPAEEIGGELLGKKSARSDSSKGQSEKRTLSPWLKVSKILVLGI